MTQTFHFDLKRFFRDFKEFISNIKSKLKLIIT